MRDIQIHLPAVWEKVDNARKKLMFDNLKRLIHQGQREKLIKDLPSDIIVTVFLASITSIVNPRFIMNSNYNIDGVINFTFEILLNGILTVNGKKILENLTIKL